MSSRKRKNSPSLGTENHLSKRAKLLADLWKTQEGSVGTTQGSHSNLSSPVYRIKAIIGENPTEYHIDWADNPITGEKFKPDWQPKKNVNTAAVEAWERRKSAIGQSNSSRPKRQRRRRKRPGSNRDCTTSDTAVETRRPQPQHIRLRILYILPPQNRQVTVTALYPIHSLFQDLPATHPRQARP